LCVAEVLTQWGQRLGAVDLKGVRATLRSHSWKEFVFNRDDLKEVGILNILRSALFGWIVGVLPGGGGAMASLINYSFARAFSKKKAEYGQGSVEGVGAAETGNNAMCGGAAVPMVLFGIPGDSVTAIILGVLLIHGLIPGPYLLIEQGHLVAALYAGLFVAAVLVYLTFLLAARQYVWLCSVRKSILYPFIMLAALIGLYGSTYSFDQLLISGCLGLIIWYLRSGGYPTVPFLMGFILGPLLERFVRTTLSMKSYSAFVTSPISIALWILTLLSIFIFGFWLPKLLKRS